MMYEIRNSAQNDTLDIHIYSEICKSFWEDDDVMDAEKFRKALEENKNAKNINVYINSMGGSVSEGVAIYSQLKRHDAHVTAYIDGFACSIASVIPMAADKVVMSDCSMMMIHNPWTISYGNAKELRKVADDLDKILDGSIIPAYKAKTGDKISDEKLRELINNETYLTSKECLEYGFCDEILESSDKKDEAKNKFNEAVDAAKSQIMNRLEQMYAKAINPPKAEESEPEEPEKEVPEAEEPEKEQPAPEEPAKEEPENNDSVPDAPAENKTHEIFMKMLKGEI